MKTFKLINFLKKILWLAVLYNITAWAESSGNALLQNIDVQILSREEVKVILKLAPKDNAEIANNINKLIVNKNSPSPEEQALPVPLINKNKDLLSVVFNNLYVKLENNVINIDHNLLKNIKVVQTNARLELIMTTKPGIFYTLEQEKSGYVLTLMTKDKVGNVLKSENLPKPEPEPKPKPVESKNINSNLNNLEKEIDDIKQESNEVIKKIEQVVKSQPTIKPTVQRPMSVSNGISGVRPILKNIDFSLTEEKAAKITLEFSNKQVPMTVLDSGNQEKKLTVEFKDIVVPENLQKIYDVNDYGTVVDKLSWNIKPKNNISQLIIDNEASVEYVAYQLNNNVIIEIKSRAETKDDNFKLKKEYVGKRISLNFQSIELRAVLQLIADFTDLNLVASDTVQGNISLRLMNVPWDQALDIILKTKNLDKRYYGNILMIAPSAEIFDLEKAELESERLVERLIKLETEYFHISYAKAEDLVALINTGTQGSVLSERGKASFDKRTNILIVQDTPNKLKQISKVIKKLDTPVRQVLIEARLVKADTNFDKDLGIRWGLSAKRSSNDYRIGIGSNAVNASQTLSLINPNANGGIILPTNAITGTGATGGASGTASSGFNIDLGITNPTSALGLALAKLPGGTLVHLELSALEAEGMVETISTPKIITANKVPAKIEQGQEIPYQEASSSGATNTSFKKAVLSLVVTPQITPDNKIIMDLKVTNDTVAASLVVNGVPAIDTQEIESQVLVNDSETVVLGGIFTQNVRNSVERVPFFGELPYIGQLFRRNITQDKRSEFLIFITPKIVVDKAVS
ncbi:MAG: type IV pilus secretin PilQ family protein [Gammaproteobacteria bacterium]|nr:type IV pilus secretin PilQ family protein [Gammaproteobacteria bacterium]